MLKFVSFSVILSILCASAIGAGPSIENDHCKLQNGTLLDQTATCETLKGLGIQYGFVFDEEYPCEDFSTRIIFESKEHGKPSSMEVFENSCEAVDYYLTLSEATVAANSVVPAQGNLPVQGNSQTEAKAP